MGDLDFECVHPAECQAVCVWISFALATTARTSAASSKSEFVSRPLGVSTDITSLAMSSGNPSLQTTGGGVLSQRENHTPPTPSAAAL